MSYKRITIPMSEAEQTALRMAASRECRRPDDHARWLVLSALGIPIPLNDESTNANDDTQTLAGCVVVAA